MSTLQLQLGLVVLLLLANAAFAGSEIALITLRQGQVDRLARKGKAGRVLAELAKDPNEFLATIQIGITLAGFLASATAATAFADEIAPWLGFAGAAAGPVAIVLVTTLLTFLTLVAGELAPKRVAMARAERWALIAARPLRWLAAASRPAVWLLGKATNGLVRLAGVDPRQQADAMTDEEVRDLLLTQPGFSRQRHILEGALDLGDRTLRQILVPRRKVTTVPVEASVAEAVAILRELGHSRAPLCDDLDDVRGVVHLKDLAGASGSAAAVARNVLHLPETLLVVDALRAMQQQRHALAVVVDEYGGGAGIVTIEDILEEIVGEIYDEFDRDHQRAKVFADGSMLVEGAFPLHDLEDFDITLPASDATTVAGAILERLGRLPAPGDSARAGDWTLVVVEVTNRAITKVRIVPADGEAEAAPPS